MYFQINKTIAAVNVLKFKLKHFKNFKYIKI